MPEVTMKFDVAAQKPSKAAVPAKVAPSPAPQAAPKAARKPPKSTKAKAKARPDDTEREVKGGHATHYFRLESLRNSHDLKTIIKFDLDTTLQDFCVDAINFYLEKKGIDFTAVSPK